MSIPKTQREIQRKLKVLVHAPESRNISKACRYFGVSRDTSSKLSSIGMSKILERETPTSSADPLT